MIGRELLALGGGHAADLRRDDLERRAFLLHRLAQRDRARASSTPSVTRTPTLRPLSVGSAFVIRLSAGDGSRSIGVARRRDRRRPCPSMPSAVLDRRAERLRR